MQQLSFIWAEDVNLPESEVGGKTKKAEAEVVGNFLFWYQFYQDIPKSGEQPGTCLHWWFCECDYRWNWNGAGCQFEHDS